MLLAVCVAAMVVGNVSPFWERLTELVLIYALVSQALDLVSGYGGMFSLGHSGLFAIGAYTSAILFSNLGVPVLVCFVAAIGVTSLAGAALGGPSLVIGGLNLALVTLAFAFIVAQFLNDAQSLTNGPTGIGPLQPAYSSDAVDRVIGTNYLLVLALIMGIAWIMLRRVVASRWKRALVAIRESPMFAHAVGVRVNRTKITAFVVSAGFTGLAGALYAHLGYISPADLTYQLSVSFLAIIFLGGVGTLTGAVPGAAILIVVPQVISASPNVTLVLYGLVLVIVMVLAPSGIVGGITTLVRRARSFGNVARGSEPEAAVADVVEPGERRLPLALRAKPVAKGREGARAGNGVLVASGVSKTYMGLRALQDVSVSVRAGELVGLIGPNGSGKTTFLNCIGGQVAADCGRIEIDGYRLDGRPPVTRAEHRVLRTFQHGALCRSLTCVENVMLGGHMDARTRFATALFSVRRRTAEERRLRTEAEDMLDYIGVPSVDFDRLPSELPYGLTRLVEIGAVLMAKPRVVLLDEPAAGLVEEEVGRLGQVMRDMLDQGVGILLVEHHVQLVLDLAKTVVVLDGGETIAEGTPSSVVSHPAVREAYLGHAWSEAAKTISEVAP